jgi:catechol 2,3-dioxygenase-like lactoylglutathione lyase family enzyme
MTAELNGIAQVAIPAKDINRAVSFYRDQLGMPVLMSLPTMAFLQSGEVRVYLDANPGSGSPGGYSHLYFRTGDIERAHAGFKERGIAIHEAPRVIGSLADHDVWLMWIRDSESNLIGIMEDRRK